MRFGEHPSILLEAAVTPFDSSHSAMKPIPLTSLRRTPAQACLTGLALLGLSSEALRASDEIIAFNEIATIHREVVIPIPSEVFNVLDQFDVTRNDWRRELNVPKTTNCQNRTHFALFLGRIVAEGFLAVEAQDREAISDLGRQVLSVAEELGLRRAVIKHSKSIIEEANDGDWEAVRAEFDATRQTVRDEMERRRDQDLSHCVSVGGWIRGTEIITAILQQHYSAKSSEILHQPQLLEHFTTTFEENPRFRRDARMKNVVEKLGDLEPRMSKEGPISLNQVKEIHGICHDLTRKTLSP